MPGSMPDTKEYLEDLRLFNLSYPGEHGYCILSSTEYYRTELGGELVYVTVCMSVTNESVGLYLIPKSQHTVCMHKLQYYCIKVQEQEPGWNSGNSVTLHNIIHF